MRGVDHLTSGTVAQQCHAVAAIGGFKGTVGHLGDGVEAGGTADTEDVRGIGGNDTEVM